jgi:monoamine oxidase
MGSNGKLHIQFRTRHWNRIGNNGDTHADTGYQNTWEVTRGQTGQGRILVNYTCGNVARSATGTPVQTVLSQILPGISSQWNQKAQLEHWPSYPLTRGSYSLWKAGQYTAFAGIEGEPEGSWPLLRRAHVH